MESKDASLLFIIILSLCFGVSFNLIIIVSSFHHGVRKKNPVDLIFFVLGLSNVILQCLQASIYLIYMLYGFSLLTLSYLHIGLFDTSFLSVCMVSFLSTFFCFKNVPFKNHFFTFFKSRFSIWLPWLILGSFVVYLMLLLPMTGLNAENSRNNNGTSYNSDFTIFTKYIMAINIILSVPYLLILWSLGSTITSLTLHIKTMQSSSSLGRSHWRPHMNAAQTIILLLLWNILFYESMVYLTSCTHDNSSLWIWICTVLYYSFCTLQALTLILGNRKQFAQRIFCSFYSDHSRKVKTNVSTRKTSDVTGQRDSHLPACQQT